MQRYYDDEKQKSNLFGPELCGSYSPLCAGFFRLGMLEFITLGTPKLYFYLHYLQLPYCLVITSILLFAKISLQREVPVRFSRIVNLAATVAFAIGAAVFYRVFSILSFVSASPAMALILCLQLCSLAYDLFRSGKLD